VIGTVWDWIVRKRDLLINVLAVVGLSFMVSTGRANLGVWGFVVFTVLFAGWKLWRGREVFLRTVRMGADHLRFMKEAGKEKEKENDNKGD